MTGVVVAAAWLASGVLGLWLVNRYFVREYGDGLPRSRWLLAIGGLMMLYLAIDLLLTWQREDRAYAQEDAS